MPRASRIRRAHVTAVSAVLSATAAALAGRPARFGPLGLIDGPFFANFAAPFDGLGRPPARLGIRRRQPRDLVLLGHDDSFAQAAATVMPKRTIERCNFTV